MLYIDNIANGRGSNASFEMSADITEDKSTHCIKCKMLSDWPPVAQVCVCVCVCVCESRTPKTLSDRLQGGKNKNTLDLKSQIYILICQLSGIRHFI